jgi:hypothetical protein
MNSSDLQLHGGFENWFPFKEETLSRIPETTGVYIFRIPNGKAFGRLKGNSDILYIGSSESSLRKRLRFYLQPGPRQLTNIRINKMLKKYSVELSWIQNTKPKELETELISKYFGQHDELPPFNAQSGASKEDFKPIHINTGSSLHSANRSKVLEIIAKSVEGFCDDCISSRSGVKPRQQVNIITRSLATSGQITRIKSICQGCGSRKIVNSMKEQRKAVFLNGSSKRYSGFKGSMERQRDDEKEHHRGTHEADG